MSREQIQSVLSMCAPFTSEDNVKITLDPSGNIIAEIEELGTTGRIIMGTTSIKGTENPFSVVMSRSSLAKIKGVAPATVEFTVEEDLSGVSVNLSGDIIRLGLPMSQKEIETDFDVAEKESILSEVLLGLMVRAQCSNVRGASPKNTMVLGEKIEFASTASVTEVSGGLKELKVCLAPKFSRFIETICRVGGTVEIINTKAGEVVFKCENVEYKTLPSKELLQSLEDMLEKEPTMTAKVGKEKIQTILARLSIPLSDDADIQITMDEKSKELVFEVVDVGGRKSVSRTDVIAHKGAGTISIKLQHLQACLAVTDKDVDFSLRSTPDDTDTPVLLQVTDSKQNTYIRGNVD